jgi:uncharacterized protein (TIGR02646 family)
MSVSDAIYASYAVKVALEVCHYGKCCYCETYVPKPFAYSHVEHWRPKGGSRQGRDAVRIRPGYYWLAYDWDNLLLSCAPCNSNKSDLFPLENPAARARNHRMRIEDEIPAILKPDGDRDPRDHITFRRETPEGRTELGKKTIEVLFLDTEMYDEPRRTHLKEIENKREWSIRMMGSIDPDSRNYAQILRRDVEEAVLPDKPYSAMVAAYLAVNPLPPLLPTARS